MSIGEPPPWPYWQYPMYYSPPPPCDHCLCLDPKDWEMSGRSKPHMKCCHCNKLYYVEPIVKDESRPTLSPPSRDMGGAL